MLKKTIWANFQRTTVPTQFLTQKIVTKLSKIWVWDPRSEKTYSGSRIQGSKKPRIRNTVNINKSSYTCRCETEIMLEILQPVDQTFATLLLLLLDLLLHLFSLVFLGGFILRGFSLLFAPNSLGFRPANLRLFGLVFCRLAQALQLTDNNKRLIRKLRYRYW